jgi:hypothetical protein
LSHSEIVGYPKGGLWNRYRISSFGAGVLRDTQKRRQEFLMKPKKTDAKAEDAQNMEAKNVIPSPNATIPAQAKPIANSAFF